MRVRTYVYVYIYEAFFIAARFMRGSRQLVAARAPNAIDNRAGTMRKIAPGSENLISRGSTKGHAETTPLIYAIHQLDRSLHLNHRVG